MLLLDVTYDDLSKSVKERVDEVHLAVADRCDRLIVQGQGLPVSAISNLIG